jgi:hypothetical protein
MYCTRRRPLWAGLILGLGLVLRRLLRILLWMMLLLEKLWKGVEGSVEGLVDLSSYSFALQFPLYPHSKMTTRNRTYQQLPLHSWPFLYSLLFQFQKSSDFNRPHKISMFRIKSFAILLHVALNKLL